MNRALISAALLAVLSAPLAQANELCREPNRFVLGASREAIAQMYPPAAAQARVEGDVVLRCLKRGSGRLEKCAVKSEFPSGYGFGAAALRIVAMQGEQITACGGAVNGVGYRRVEAPIRFRAPDAADPAPPPSPQA
jgi:hypothetical protein